MPDFEGGVPRGVSGGEWGGGTACKLQLQLQPAPGEYRMLSISNEAGPYSQHFAISRQQKY